MDIIPSSQRGLLLDYMKLLKFSAANWLIVEVKLMDKAMGSLTGEGAASLLKSVFASYQGRVLICNPFEVLMLIEWGKENSPHMLSKQVAEHLPPDICEITVVPPTQKGVRKIELLLAPLANQGSLYQARMQREENVFLVADDDMYMRLLVKKGLEAHGRIAETGDGLQVPEFYKTHNPDIVLLDIHMPGLNGQEVLWELMKIDPQAFVVMLSADSSIDNVQWSKQHGAKGFLTKPFDKAKLLSYLQMCPTTKA